MVLSYGVSKRSDVRELYPFFHWRLFAEPIGWEGETSYRLYTRAAEGGRWERQPVRSVPGYSAKDYIYQWNSLTREALADGPDREPARERLALFARLAAPEAAGVRVVAETYHPLDLLDRPAAYDTATVLRLW